MKTDPVETMVALSMLGRVLDSPALWPGFLIGAMDEELLPAFAHVIKDMPSLEGETQEQHARRLLEDNKAILRMQLQASFSRLGEDLEREAENNKRQEQARILKSMQQLNKPAPEGTVKELAARYGVSISVVRKYKAEGRLCELAQDAANKDV